VAGRKSPVSLYNPHIATMEADPTQAYNQDDATGFIRLNALRLKVGRAVDRTTAQPAARKKTRAKHSRKRGPRK
ncbi:MAG: argininosuccinate synthase, partial [Verrucomicrobiae bacterium]|nr:argininosuccinate synthase [Verrucomicrobiae bacterium]